MQEADAARQAAEADAARQAEIDAARQAEAEAAAARQAKLKLLKEEEKKREDRQQKDLEKRMEDNKIERAVVLAAVLAAREAAEQKAKKEENCIKTVSKNKKNAEKEANCAYQITRLYSKPPCFSNSDERRTTGNYGLLHLAMTVTKLSCFKNIISYLLPSDAACVIQAHKFFGPVVEAVEEQLAKYLHQNYFLNIALEISARAGVGDSCSSIFSWTHYSHMLLPKVDKILLMAGYGGCGNSTNRVIMMGIDNFTKEEIEQIEEATGNTHGHISWQQCQPMVKKHYLHSAIYNQGAVFSVECSNGKSHSNTVEYYDTISQITTIYHFPPIDCSLFALAEFDNKPYLIGGIRRTRRSDRVYCFDKDSSMWIEQEARLNTARHSAAAITYQDKLWLAGGVASDNSYGFSLSSVEVFDPLVGLWQEAGDLIFIKTSIKLFVINDELFAAGLNYNTIGVEKYDRESGVWQVVSKCHADRHDCGLAACGSTIYFLGGGGLENMYRTWDSFDTSTNTWASQNETIFTYSNRRLPYQFSNGQAVSITSNEYIKWTPCVF